jgi:hypothetical protein
MKFRPTWWSDVMNYPVFFADTCKHKTIIGGSGCVSLGVKPIVAATVFAPGIRSQLLNKKTFSLIEKN